MNKNRSIHKTPEVYSIENEVVFTHIDGRIDVEALYSLNAAYLPSHKKAVVVFMLLTKGKAEAVSDKPSLCEAGGDNFMCLPLGGHPFSLTVSDDAAGYMLMITKRFADNMTKGRKILSIPQMISMRHRHTVCFTGDDMKVMLRCMDDIERRFADDKNLFSVELTRIAIMAFFYENINIVLSHGRIVPEKRAYDRKDMMVGRFVEMLVSEIEEHHDVGYYADRLCVTSHYLSKVLKSVLGMSAGQIINELLAERAMSILREPETTAQQVADRLGFSDQSSFGKFFKRHVGISPMRFKKRL